MSAEDEEDGHCDWRIRVGARERCGPPAGDVRQPFHHHEAGAIQVVYKPLGDDLGHDLIGVVDTLATLEAQREGQRVNDVGRIGSLRAANRPRKLNRGVDGALTLGNVLDRRRQPESDACGCVLPGGGANGRLPPFASLSDTVKGRP